MLSGVPQSSIPQPGAPLSWAPLPCVLLTCILLAACAGKPPPPPPPPVPPPVATGVDGLYRGTSTRFQADGRHCPHPGLVKLDVMGGHFQFRWDRTTYVESTVNPDGSVVGGAVDITLLGKAADKKIEGDVTNGDCGLHFTTRRQQG